MPKEPPACVNNILEAIGNTPMVRLSKLTQDVRTQVMAKCEFMNPGGSVKDRIGIAIIEAGERSRGLKPGGLIVEDMIPAASDAIQGAWVSWLLYNVRRAVGLTDTRQRAIGSGQVDLVLSALLRMEKQADRLTDIAMRYAC